MRATADPQRNARLDRARVDEEAVEVVVVAVVLGLAVATARRGSARIASSARAPRSANGAPSSSNSSLQRADADAEDHAAAGDDVERAVALGDRERVVVAEHEHVRGEADRLGVRAERTERRERVVVAAAAHLGDVDRNRDVLAARAVVVAEPVGLLHDGDDVGERAPSPPTARARAAGA